MRSVLIAAAATAGFLSLAPAAFAGTATPTEPAPASSIPATTTTYAPPADQQFAGIDLAPQRVHPGEKAQVVAVCWEELMPETPYTSSLWGKGTMKVLGSRPGTHFLTDVEIPESAKPGVYSLSFDCHHKRVTGKFTVLPAKSQPKPATHAPPKQVAKVPSGAPQTGGTDGPVSDGPDVTAIAVAGAGVIALGGGGFALYRRRRTEG